MTDLERYQDAVASVKRRPDEELWQWAERVGVAARPVGDRELPTGDREPGEDE